MLHYVPPFNFFGPTRREENVIHDDLFLFLLSSEKKYHEFLTITISFVGSSVGNIFYS